MNAPMVINFSSKSSVYEKNICTYIRRFSIAIYGITLLCLRFVSFGRL